MSNLKDTDFDDLFRRASEKYPLRTDSSDWDKMSAALEKDPPPPDDGEDSTDRRKKRRFLWLFFLLPLGVGGLGYYAWHVGARTKVGATTNAAVAAKTPQADLAKPDAGLTKPDGSSTKPDGSSTKPETGSVKPEAGLATPMAAASTSGKTSAATTSLNTNAAVGTSPDASPANSAPGIIGNKGIAGNKGITGNIGNHRSNTGRQINGDRQSNPDRQFNGDRQINAGQQTKTGDISEENDAFAAANVKANTDVKANAAANGKGSANVPASGNPFSISIAQQRQDRLFYDLQRAPIDRSYQLNVNVVEPAAKKDSSTTKQKTSPKPTTAHFYAGILGAPDLSTVKMQAVKGVGTTFGVLAGYAFNPHWAVETGAYLDRKRYYTEGEYFNTGKVKIPPGSTLNNVDGTCYMWEIPLNIRYTFNPGAKTRWFATAGFSTYLMSSEKYTYSYEYNNGGNSWSDYSSWHIKKPSQYPFSIINISGGFEQRLGKVGNLRIEPYLRIPLTDMGTGKLPIMSTGINIGITRQLW
jgi:Outer membrane protein beta-barrel domain